MKNTFIIVFFAVCLQGMLALGQYLTPPTVSTYYSGSSLSESEREAAVREYTEIREMEDAITRPYSRPTSSDVERYNALVDHYNSTYAGHDASSIGETTREMNREASSYYPPYYP